MCWAPDEGAYNSPSCLGMVVKLSLMIVYDDDAGATQRRFMAMERDDLGHRSDVERLMNSLVPRGWCRSRWDRKPCSVPKPPPLKLCSVCDELKPKPEFSGQNWTKKDKAGCRCCMVRRTEDQKSRREARISFFATSFVYPLPLDEEQLGMTYEEAFDQVMSYGGFVPPYYGVSSLPPPDRPVMTAGQRHSLHEWLIAEPLPTPEQRNSLPKPLPEPGGGVSDDGVTVYDLFTGERKGVSRSDYRQHLRLY